MFLSLFLALFFAIACAPVGAFLLPFPHLLVFHLLPLWLTHKIEVLDMVRNFFYWGLVPFIGASTLPFAPFTHWLSESKGEIWQENLPVLVGTIWNLVNVEIVTFVHADTISPLMDN